MPSVQRTPGDQHVASGEPWVGEVSLLKNDHGVPEIPGQKIDLHRRPRRQSSKASLNQAAPRASLGREGYDIRLRFFPRGIGCPTPYLICHLPMLCLHVPCHQSISHILPTISLLHPSLLLIPVGMSLSHNTSTVCRLRLGPRHLAWASYHADCIPDISLQDHPIEQADQGTKFTLEPSWV